MTDLVSAVLGDPQDEAQGLELRRGVVTSVNPLQVLVGSSTVAQPCQALTSYSGTVGDAVSVLVINGDRVVLGSTRPQAPTYYTAANGSGTGFTSGTAVSTIAVLDIPETGTPGNFYVHVDAYLSFNAGPASYDMAITLDDVPIAIARIPTASLLDGTYSTSTRVPTGGFSPTTLKVTLQQTSGTGSANWTSDSRFLHLHAIFQPGA